MENLMDKILEERGLNYEDLNQAERDTYNRGNFSTKQITVSDIKNYVAYMKDSIALQLTDTPTSDPDTLHVLQARLKNYIVLEDFLLRPEKAEEAFRKSLEAKGK